MSFSEDLGVSLIVDGDIDNNGLSEGNSSEAFGKNCIGLLANKGNCHYKRTCRGEGNIDPNKNFHYITKNCPYALSKNMKL